jgi:hypothetical protein
MKRLLYLGSAILVGFSIGIGSAWWAIGRGMSGGVPCGAWVHYPNYGSVAANPYTRAQTQLAGPLALDRSEAIYFVALSDDRGDVLRPEYAYRIVGRHFDARWWSITVYGDDHHLIPNLQDRYSYNSENVTTDPDGTYTIHLSRKERGGNWIPMGNGKRIELFLRLYNPTQELLDNATSIDPPQIIREGDDE